MANMTELGDANISFKHIQDKLLIGPQAEVLDKINRFNELWNTNLSVTKTFRWSPGIYDKMKALLYKQFLGWDTRSNSMYTLFNKIDNNAYRKRSIGTQIQAIDNILFNYRKDGMTFQENPEEIKEYLNLFLNNLSSFVYSDDRMDIKIKVDKKELEQFNCGNYTDMSISIYVDIFPTDMNVSVWDESQHSPRDIGKIMMGYHINLNLKISFIKWFNQFVISQQNKKDIVRIGSITGGHYDRNFMNGNIERMIEGTSSILHPYISHTNRGYGGVCWGNLQEHISQYLFNLNLTMFVDILYRWATTFVVHKSHPFNQISRAFYGWPKDISKDDMMIIGGSLDPETCGYANTLIDFLEYEHEYEEEESPRTINYCTISGCQLRNNCHVYSKVFGNSEIKTPKTHRLEANQRSSPWPSWMAQDEDGTWRDTRTQLSSDMQVESDMVSNDGGEVEDRDGERTQQWVQENAQDLIQEAPMSEEEIEQNREAAETDPDIADEDTPF
tara:strand:- start:25936 stop:27435 length:1500 start_codon:yes stop_codon:yes gene_type:complete